MLYLLHLIQVKFARQEYPYDTECYPSWSSTNYTEKFLNSILWPYTFMVWWHYNSIILKDYLQLKSLAMQTILRPGLCDD